MPPRPACTNQPRSLIPGGEYGSETAHYLRYLRGGCCDGGVRSYHHVGGRPEVSQRFGCAHLGGGGDLPALPLGGVLRGGGAREKPPPTPLVGGRGPA